MPKINNRYRQGDYKVVCDKSGLTAYASECRMQYNNLFVRKDFYVERQPQDFVKSIPDKQSVPIPRPKSSTTTFVAFGEITSADLNPIVNNNR